MAIRIDGRSAAGIAGRATEQTQRAKDGSESRGGTEVGQSRADTVKLGARAKAVAVVKAASAETPEVDSARVAEIKARLANGEFEIKPEAIAEGLLTEAFGLSGS